MPRSRFVARNLNNAANNSFPALTARLTARKTKIKPIAVSRIAEPNMLFIPYHLLPLCSHSGVDPFGARLVSSKVVVEMSKPEDCVFCGLNQRTAGRLIIIYDQRPPIAGIAGIGEIIESRFPIRVMGLIRAGSID